MSRSKKSADKKERKSQGRTRSVPLSKHSAIWVARQAAMESFTLNNPELAKLAKSVMGGDQAGLNLISQPRSNRINSASDLGVKIRSARKAMDMTQQEFADLAGVGRRFISELESGKPTLEFERVLKVCRAAGIDIFAKPRAS